MQSIPCCFFPCKILVVDDNRKYLAQLRIALDKRKASYEYHDSPQEALECINGSVVAPSLLTDLQKGELNNSIHHLHQEVYNPSRFDRISTVIVDYDMPGMNGIDLCRSIQDPYIQKILLTGVADERLAIEAFNEGIINYYIKKQGPQIFYDLNLYIFQCQLRYFNLLSRPYMESMVGSHPSILKEKKFISLFEDYIEENNIVEFYMLDASGSLMCLNSKGEASAFYLFNKETLSQHDKMVQKIIAQDPDQQYLSPETRAELQQHKKIFRFNKGSEDIFPPPERWHTYLYPLNLLEGEGETYYWAYTHSVADFEKEKILPFESHFCNI